ncbi:MAG: hypothetical protein IJ721_05610 [Bacteroidales bacterium]|nr:hypothetical protein [Bacteroidales bacterium]
MKRSIFLLACAVGLCSCSHKNFSVFDALYYRDKPDLSADGISRIKLIYEKFLVTDGELDWEKVDRQVSETVEEGCRTVSIDIESWYSDRTPEEITLRLDSLFGRFRAADPDIQIGNYGVPVQNLNVLHHVVLERGVAEEEVIPRWEKSSQVREPAGSVSDILLPSLYIYNYDIDQWERDLRTTMERVRTLYPDKKVYIYLWPQCYDWKTSPYYMQFLSGDQFERLLEAAYSCTDGVILWASGVESHRDRVPVFWDDGRVQDIYAGVQRFLKRHRRHIQIK